MSTKPSQSNLLNNKEVTCFLQSPYTSCSDIFLIKHTHTTINTKRKPTSFSFLTTDYWAQISLLLAGKKHTQKSSVRHKSPQRGLFLIPHVTFPGSGAAKAIGLPHWQWKKNKRLLHHVQSLIYKSFRTWMTPLLRYMPYLQHSINVSLIC